LSSEQKENLKQSAMHAEQYHDLGKKDCNEENINKSYMIKDGILYGYGRIYMPQEMGKIVRKPVHDSNVAGQFSSGRVLEIM